MHCVLSLPYATARDQGPATGQTILLLVLRQSMHQAHPLTGRIASILSRVASIVNDEPTRSFVVMMWRSVVFQGCHAEVSCHHGFWRTLVL